MNDNATLVQSIELFIDLIYNTTEKIIHECTQN
jgi:hypothetical protein